MREYSGQAYNLILNYSMVDFDGLSRHKGSESVVLGARESTEKTIEFELPKDSFGEFDFNILLSDGNIEITATKKIFLSSEGGLTGLPISETTKARLSKIGKFILIGLGAIAVLWAIFLIVRYFRKRKIPEHKDNKRLTKIKLKYEYAKHKIKRKVKKTLKKSKFSDKKSENYDNKSAIIQTPLRKGKKK